MRGDWCKTKVILLVLLFVGGVAPSFGGWSQGTDGEGSRGPGPLATGDPWYDPLDDMSHVYVPGSGLQGVEVSGGSAHLEPGSEEGWVASEIISCPAGYRFDLLLLELDVPGNSSLRASVLNASADPSEVGFANETYAMFKLLQIEEGAGDVNIADLGRSELIRIQVNLKADGTDRPELLSWKVTFIPKDEWRDDFLGMGKIDRAMGVNLTDGTLEIDLSRRSTGTGVVEYDPFPTIFFPGNSQSASSPVFYPNQDLTGYQDKTDFNIEGMIDADFHDLNGDGLLDMACALGQDSGQNNQDSQIRWGAGPNSWPATGATMLDTSFASGVEFGDFNGDGAMDLAFGCTGGLIFLNQGGGLFNHQHDIALAPSVYFNYLDVGDLNGDGYDDIVIHRQSPSEYRCYFGGPDGPDSTVDVTLDAGSWPDEPTVVDLNDDGYMDVILATIVSGRIPVYYSGPDGPDTTIDLVLSLPSWCAQVKLGDLNGDGFRDIVAQGGQGTYRMRIWKGSGSGWIDSNTYDITFPSQYTYTLEVLDINRDGFDDIIVGAPPAGNAQFQVFYGGATWPTTPDISKPGANGWNLAVAVPESQSTGFGGTVVTDTINIPPGMKWDVAYLEGTFPLGTTAYLSVVDGATGRGIQGCTNVEGHDIDLCTVDTSFHRSIKVIFKLFSDSNTTTPSVDALTVKWMGEREWRDEFIGPAKVERSLNLEVAGGTLTKAPVGGAGPQLVFPALRGDKNFTTSPLAFCDACAGDYLGREPLDFGIKGTAGASAADVNDDGYVDLALSVRQTSPDSYTTNSPLFLNGPLGFKGSPDHRFPTKGAADVLMEDIDDDGYVDVVFAQELRAPDDPAVPSYLYWGSEGGWATRPDLEFETRGAVDVEAADLDGDGDLDLVFACNRDATPATDSMVFLQGDTGTFCETVPDHRLPTRSARAVAVADLDGDTLLDLVFANSQGAGFTEIGSYVYWGRAGGGYDATPSEVLTVGAEDVAVADLDGDSDLDLVFANHWDDSKDHDVDSFVYLNDGTGSFGTSPDARLPTEGASGVAVADIDGTGWLDLVFACEHNDTTCLVPSLIYTGGTSGWSSSPMELPTEGACAVLAANLVERDEGAYLSHRIVIDDQRRDTGTVHTFRYTATLGPSIEADLMLVDADTWEVLATTAMASGTNEWDVRDLFRVKEHMKVRVMVLATGIEGGDAITIDELWFNWTKRVWQPPVVKGFDLSSGQVLRTEGVDLTMLVEDDYDEPWVLVLTAQERLNGTTEWTERLVIDKEYDADTGVWTSTIVPKVNTEVGYYDLRVIAMDMDNQYSSWLEVPNALLVLNNRPTTPVVHLAPERAYTTSSIKVEFDARSTDVETTALTYNYTWFRDGELVPEATGDSLPTYLTAKGQNWSVEVRAWDGDDLSGSASAWVLVHNTPPAPKDVIPDPEMDEDTSDDTWVNLANAFFDADGDPLTWSLAEEPENVTVDIDHDTGTVTFTPRENWFGTEDVTFVASDGEHTTSQDVTIHVLSVNDLPVIATIDGAPPTTDPMEYSVEMNGRLVISYTTFDVEGDDVQADISVTTVTLDEGAGTLTFEPGGVIGTFTFTLRIWDVESPGSKVTIGFTIEVINENDPMEVPKITQPAPGEDFNVNETFGLVGECFDPDVQHGQELTFTWTSNVSGVLGTGASITVKLSEAGVHLITLTVSDGEFERSTTVEVTIKEIQEEPNPEPEPEEETFEVPWAMIVGIIVALALLGVVLFVFTGKRSTEKFEAEMDELEEAEEKKEALERTLDALQDLADEWEADKETSDTEDAGEYEEIDMGMPETQLTIEAKVTEEASGDVAKLWSGISESEQTEEEKEELRLDNLKRKYQNAIGRLPYGIPSKELAGMDWVELSNLLATGEKKTVEGGAEVTQLNGRWYHSDADDTGTFLKEHGKKEEPRKAAPKKSDATLSNEEILRKLEERFVLGEISESTFIELKRKYEE